MQPLKTFLKKTPVYNLYNFWNNRKKKAIRIVDEKTAIRNWKIDGKPLPPPQIFKRLVIKDYAKKYGLKVLIETGTYLGETIEYFKSFFKKLITIELDEKLYENAKEKFKNEKHIHLYQGDSGDMIKEIISDINEPCLFWLDGHYSEGITAKGKLNTPIIEELNHILNHKIDSHVILIDDARCFIGEEDYPAIEYLKNYVQQKNPRLQFSVEDDIIRIHK